MGPLEGLLSTSATLFHWWPTAGLVMMDGSSSHTRMSASPPPSDANGAQCFHGSTRGGSFSQRYQISGLALTQSHATLFPRGGLEQ